ncbi:hypothetical protein [Mycolicibacterium hippocampi]|uniref:Lipoprotein n=1 Tax=Mycolicibacterium hippocampi TaxID=659824 RepID=A0A850Q0E3_9MYCO|nr:hypothetical protein [Mycolicibacterium hippocampi]
MRTVKTVAALAAVGITVACSAPAEAPDGTSPDEPSPDGTTSESTPTSVVPSVGHGSLAYCLGQHGMPAPPGPATGPPPGVDPAKWEQAMAECSSLAPGPAG